MIHAFKGDLREKRYFLSLGTPKGVPFFLLEMRVRKVTLDRIRDYINVSDI